MAGYMMYGGRIIILGDSGERVGEDMTGGEIYVAGKIQSLGSAAMRTDISGDEDDDIRSFLDKYEISFSGSFTKIVNEGGNLRYANPEPRRRAIPFFTFSGNSEYWNEKVQEDIYVKSKIGRYRIRGYGGARALPHLNDIAFKKDLSGAGRDPEVVSKVNLKTQIGGRHGAKPLSLSMPVMISPMSFGALSKSTKLAMAKAAACASVTL